MFLIPWYAHVSCVLNEWSLDRKSGGMGFNQGVVANWGENTPDDLDQTILL